MWKRFGILGVLLACFLTTPYRALGQKEAAIWYFGQQAGLDFRDGTPTPLTDGLVDTIEGCESYSDGAGNLLFYTDGKTVWNRNHEVMPNGTGLKSSFSTSQAALVVPLPGNPDLYYIFTPDDALAYNGLIPGGSNGFNYSILDMRRDGGLGDVTEKNIDLLQNASENVTAVRNFEEDAYWILTHHRDRFYAYRLDAAGLDTQPVVSRIGPEISGENNVRGNIKISPDGQRVAITHNVLEPTYASHLYVYDFDVATGRVANILPLVSEILYYGVEFSPDSSKLYASGMPIGLNEEGEAVLGRPEILQFDLAAADVAASRYRVHQFESALLGWISGALQLGIDKKIYHSIPAGSLSVIRSPDNAGLRCDFRPFRAKLGGRRASYGLPPYIQSFFETIVDIEQFCLNAPTRFTITEDAGIASVQWDFGDPGSGLSNTSTLQNPEHTFSTYGTFEVRLQVTYENGSTREFVEFVEIAQVPDLIPEVTLVQCDLDGIDDGLTTFNLRESIALFSGGNPDINAYFFETREGAESGTGVLDDQAYRNTVTGQVVYARAFQNPDCASIITVHLETQVQEVPLQVDRVPVCLDRIPVLAVELDSRQLFEYLGQAYPGADSYGLYRTASDALLETQPVAAGIVFLGPMDGNRFWYRLEQANQCDRIGIIEMAYRLPPDTPAEVEVTLCNGEALLSAPEGFAAYLWEDGTQGQSLRVSAQGSYRVTFEAEGCLREQHFTVSEPQTFSVEEVMVRDFRQANRLEVVVASEGQPIRYSIDGGATFQDRPTFDGLDPGVYGLVVQDDCTVYETDVLVGGLPAFFSPNGDGRNDRWKLENSRFFTGYTLDIFDRYGRLLARLFEGDPEWDGRSGGRPQPADDYWYRLTLPQGRVIQGHFALIR